MISRLTITIHHGHRLDKMILQNLLARDYYFLYFHEGRRKNAFKLLNFLRHGAMSVYNLSVGLVGIQAHGSGPDNSVNINFPGRSLSQVSLFRGTLTFIIVHTAKWIASQNFIRREGRSIQQSLHRTRSSGIVA